MIFVDTNYFLRLLLRDVKRQHQEAKKLFQDGALGEIKLFTSIIVFFEIYWVLSSFYKKKRARIVGVLANTLKMNFIKLEKRELVCEAAEIFGQTSLDLEDCFNLVYARRKKAVDFKTFDRKLKAKFQRLS